MSTREQEYLRRMRRLGYEPSLAGMDDEDIGYELSRMELSRSNLPTQQLERRFRPVDPGLAARIFRQMGRPYNANALEERERYYIGGWDNGDDDEPRPQPKPGLKKTLEYWPGVTNTEVGMRTLSRSASEGTANRGEETWLVDPMFPGNGARPASGNADVGGAPEHYRNNEVGLVTSSPDYRDAGASRNDEARAGTADDFTFTADPLENMGVRGKAKSNTYGWVRENNDGTAKAHQGVDIWAQDGTAIRSVEDGVIHETGEAGAYGKYIIVRFEKGGKTRYALYAHLSDNSIPKGWAVKAGEVIGATGSTGNAGGKNNPIQDQHLHFEVADSDEFGPGLGSGRRDPMRHFRTKMEVNPDI